MQQNDPGIDLATVRHVAALARLSLDESEVRDVAQKFARTLEHFRALAALDVEGVEPMTGAAPLADVTRADEPRPSPGADRLLAAAPERVEDFFSVPKTVGGEE